MSTMDCAACGSSNTVQNLYGTYCQTCVDERTAKDAKETLAMRIGMLVLDAATHIEKTGFVEVGNYAYNIVVYKQGNERYTLRLSKFTKS